MIVILENIGWPSVNVAAVDAKLRQRFSSLVAWGYSFIDDSLMLEFPDSEVETVIENKISTTLSEVKKDYSAARFGQAVLKRRIVWVE